MDFLVYRESILQTQKLAGNFTSLSRADLAELSRLNAKCITLSEEMINSFSSLIDEIEEGLSLLLERLGRIKKDLGRISGPGGTLEDILGLEPDWSRVHDLYGAIQPLLKTGQTSEDTAPSGKSMAIIISATGPEADLKDKGQIAELAGTARKEAAVTVEKPAAANSVSVTKISKKPTASSQNAKPALLPVNKNCGETEKKIMEEITKNLEAIKSNRKKI